MNKYARRWAFVTKSASLQIPLAGALASAHDHVAARQCLPSLVDAPSG